jgi:hypothetical protein
LANVDFGRVNLSGEFDPEHLRAEKAGARTVDEGPSVDARGDVDGAADRGAARIKAKR